MADPDLQTPRDFVDSGWRFYQNMSSSVISKAMAALSQLADYNVPFSPVNVEYGGSSLPGSFVAPPAPTTPTIKDITFTMPTEPTITVPKILDFGDAPAEPRFNLAPYMVPGGEPGDAPQPPNPDDLNPPLAVVTVDPPPNLNLPGAAALLPVRAIDAPDLDIPQFLSTLPVDTTALPGNHFSFTELQFSDTLLDTVKAKLIAMSQGGTGLPPAIEQALFDRSRSREDTNALAAYQGISDELGSRGFDEPPGELPQRLLQARQNNQNQKNALNREITIRVHEVEVEQLRFWITQGVACTQILISQNNAINDRALKAAEIAQGILIQMFNAAVEKLRLQYDGYKAEAGVFETRMRALGIQGDIYKTQVTAQQVIAETNQAIVATLSEEVKVELAKLEAYRVQLEGKKLILETNAQKLTQARMFIENYGEEVKAWGIGWEGYKTKVDASLAGLRGDEILANVYSARTNAYNTKGNVAIAVQKTQLEGELSKLQKYDALIRALVANIQGQSATADARARLYAAQGQVYAAGGEIAKAEADTLDRAAEIQMADSKNRADLQLKVQDVNLQALLQLFGLNQKSLEGRAQVLAQLAASVLSGAHFGANYSGDLGVNFSYGKSFGYSGGTPDVSPNF